MAESTLSLSYTDLTAEVGHFLGHGRGVDNGDRAWSTQETKSIESCVRSGLRQFYFPPPIEGQMASYDWSFLKPMTTIDLVDGAVTAILPDDFGGVEGKIVISTSTTIAWIPLEIVGVGRIYSQAAQYPTTTGRPQVACVEPLKGTTPLRASRSQLRLWPIADTDYTLRLQYYLHPAALTETAPYAYGGAAHAETILESCLAIAEQRLDDAAAVHSMKFKERLLASINMDRRNKPQSLGYNDDRSDILNREWPSRYGRFWDGSGISINGQTY